MKIINNITDKLSDELKEKLEPGSKLSIAAACFSVYAFEELKTQLEGIDALRFIFTSPTFLAEQPEKAQREFYIPRLNREKTLYGSEFEIRLRNEFTQKAISRECAEWVRRKASFKSNVTSELMPGFMTVENAAPCAFAPVNGFTRADLGCERGGNMFSMINEIDAPESAAYLDMSISEITPANILLAVSKVAKECKYQEATVKTIISALRDIFSYAATCGHAYNILSKNRAGDKSNNLTTLMIQRILAPAMANAELKELNDSCPRALTIGQQGRLALYAAEHVLEDGRFCGILISLYTGIRPAECRGLRWNDFRSFPDHPDRHYLKVDEILNDKLEYSRQLKTKNALRCIPVHIEIEGALQKRKKFVQQNMGENTDIGELPIVCFENEFKDPCRGPDYSNFAFKLLKEFGVSSEQLGFSLLDEFDNLTPSDSHPPMRILRRNFATVIQACTDLSLEEKEYIFGHRISGKDGAKKRIEYNRNMDRLWRIAQKLDKAPFCKKLYELHFPQIIVGDGIVVQEGRGQGTIRIPWESAVYGQKLHLHFEGGPNTSVSISTPNAVRPFGGLPVEVKMADAPISWGDPLPPINAEAMHWEAVRKVRYLKKTDK